MADQSGSRKILLALNEDGLGPLTFGFHIARGILQNDSKTRLTIRRNTRMDEFEELLRTYSKAEKWAGEFSLDPVDNLIRVKKKDKSQVDLETTMKRLMLYPKQRLSYPPPPSDDPYDLVIDFGVPTLAHLSAESSVPHVTVFDHSWGFTFLQMAREYNKKYIKPRLRGKLSIPRLKKILEPTPLIRTAIEAIIADESRTNAVYLFPFYLTPIEFYIHWSSLGVEIKMVPGVFGSSEPSPKFTDKVTLKKKFDIPDDGKVVLISGGGTGVWDQLLPQIIDEFLKLESQGELDYYVVSFMKNDYFQNQDIEDHPEGYSTDFGIPRVPKAGYSKKIRLLKFKQTRLIYQDIIDGVTLIVTRAGGATVNDAIARRIPLVFVSEQGHWQVEAIRKEVEAQHLAAEGIPYEVFTEDPAEAVQEITRRVNDHGANTNITERMAGKAPEREFWLRQQLV